MAYKELVTLLEEYSTIIVKTNVTSLVCDSGQSLKQFRIKIKTTSSIGPPLLFFKTGSIIKNSITQILK